MALGLCRLGKAFQAKAELEWKTGHLSESPVPLAREGVTKGVDREDIAECSALLTCCSGLSWEPAAGLGGMEMSETALF